ncbi:MAG: hypothetical protein KDA41_22155, partial [Planctomycetales bacterium]|nr:hypothetical protein [Planctomycetales bacterium]
LCKLYVAVCRDTDMALDARKTLRAKLYTRLIRIKQDLEADLSRRKRDADAETPTYPIVESAAAYSQSTVDPAPRGGGTVRDYGEALVELIQATISPKHWDVNGGPGSIVYWPTLHVLVVRASGDTHGHVGGLFDGLRRVP